MIANGVATIYVSNMDRAVEFYTEVLQLQLSARYGDDWATVQAGPFTIGLHPRTKDQPAPGTAGATQVGLTLQGTADDARMRLLANDVPGVQEVHRGDGGSFVYFNDLDGNVLYLWEVPKPD